MRAQLKIGLVVLFAMISSSSFAAKSLDLTGSIASSPGGDFDVGFGLTGGLSLDVADFAATNDITKNLQLRGDISYFHWGKSEMFEGESFDLSYRRIPIFLGARYMVPADKLRLYGELGLEISFDRVSSTFDFFGVPATVSDSATRAGVSPGGGIQYLLNNDVFIGANLRLHIITDTYVSAGVTAGFQFK